MLEITLGSITGTSATVINVSDDCVRYKINVTGTNTGATALITVEDHYEDINVTGTFVTGSVSGSIANITFRPYLSSSSATCNGYSNLAQVPNDSEINFTMKDVTDLVPHYEFSRATDINFWDNAIVFTANVVWETYSYYNLGPPIRNYLFVNMHSIHCPDRIYNGLFIDYASNPRLVVVSDWVAFVTYWGYDGKFHLVRLDVPDTGNGGGTIVITELYTWNDVDTYGGDDFEAWKLGWMVRCKYEDIDKLVIVTGYKPDTADVSDIIRVVVWDLVTNSLSYDEFADCKSSGSDVAFLWYGSPFAPPGIYQDKIVFSVSMQAVLINQVICPCPTYVFDCSTDTLTGNFNYTVDTTLTDPHLSYGAAMNVTTGAYYFWLSDGYAWTDDALMKLDLAGGGIQMVTHGVYAENHHMLQGEQYAYVVEAPGRNANGTIRRADNMGDILCSFPRYLPDITDYDNGYHVAIDDTNNVAWVINGNELLGKSLLGMVDSSIDINWIGGVIPFTYVTEQIPELMFMLCGNVIMNVQSYLYQRYPLPILYQNDYYVLAHV